MSYYGYEGLKFEDAAFDAVRAEVNYMMQNLFSKMKKSGSDEASLTLKIDIALHDDVEELPESGPKRIKKPEFNHKITTQVNVKDSSAGRSYTGMALDRTADGEWICGGATRSR